MACASLPTRAPLTDREPLPLPTESTYPVIRWHGDCVAIPPFQCSRLTVRAVHSSAWVRVRDCDWPSKEKLCLPSSGATF